MARAIPPRRVDLYNPNLFEKLALPKNIEISQDHHSEIVQRLTPKNAETKKANPAYAQTVATLQIP